MEIVRNYGITFFVFIVIDLLWLGVLAKNFYAKQLGSLMKSNVNWIAAIIFYMFFVAGMMFFVIYPALKKQSWQYALLIGLLYGFITYMTYDLTNLATIKNWPLVLSLVDIGWGSFLGGSTALISYFLIRLFP